MLQHHIGPHDYLFTNEVGKPVNRENFLKRKLRPAARRAKIPVLDVDFQMLRRSFATVAGAIGCDVKTIQAQLGHARPDMSLTEYIQPVADVLRSQMKRLEDILRGRVPMPVDLQNKLGSGTVQ
jgi:integrase